jgi:IS5 family transposase
MATMHDSRVDLSIEGEDVIREEDISVCLLEVMTFTIVRRTTDTPLCELDRERNKLISKLRSPGEKPHAVIKRVFGPGRVLVTTMRKFHVKIMVAAFTYSLYQLCTLKNAKVIWLQRKLRRMIKL